MPVPLNIENIETLPKLNLPEFQFKFRADEVGNAEIFDNFRKRYVKLTPEEWVRQNFALYLVQYQNYPLSRIKFEKTLRISGSMRRCDIVYFDKSMQPEIIVECKSTDVSLINRTFSQAAMYNSILKVKYLIITNCLTHFVTQIDYDNNKFEFLNSIPKYK